MTPKQLNSTPVKTCDHSYCICNRTYSDSFLVNFNVQKMKISIILSGAPYRKTGLMGLKVQHPMCSSELTWGTLSFINLGHMHIHIIEW